MYKQSIGFWGALIQQVARILPYLQYMNQREGISKANYLKFIYNSN